MPNVAAKTFRDLKVWQKAHALVLEVYEVSATFPRAETYGLTSQLRRAAVSVPSNIAEGFRRRGRADKARFFNLAEASLDEASYLLLLARELRYGDDRLLQPQVDEVCRMLSAYARSVSAPKATLLPPDT